MADHLETEAKNYIERRNLLLKGVDPAVVRSAWFTLAHLLLSEGDHVVDMGCDDGAVTYAMAALYPRIYFTGLDKSKRQIMRAKEQYRLPNLDFKIGDASSDIFDPESLDAIINSYVLHEIFSASRYNERIVSDTLRKQFKALKKGGAMFIRDYARPPPEEFVLLEMPDEESAGEDLAHLSEADLLVWYAEHARPRQDAGCGGFFLEELPCRVPGTRLFRLPYRWAYEFIMRKDDRAHWETHLPLEYTFFTPREFRQELSALGARVQYSAPYWDEDMINARFEGRFRLFDDQGRSLGNPPTCFVAVSYKMTERKSLNIEERRPSASASNALKISAMRNQKTGEIVDVVSRDLHISEVIPYRIDSDGHLKIYLHDGVARSIANAVPRGGINIDGRRWSGHMVETMSVDGAAISEMEAFDEKHTVLFARDHLGLKPDEGAVLEHGPDYYPAPDYIDEKIHTYYLKVSKAKGPLLPKSLAGMTHKFQAKGMIREMEAQQILDAITVGMIPNARLEMQILSLYHHLGLRAQTWTGRTIDLQLNKIANPANVSGLLKAMGEPDERFKTVKGSAGQLRPIHSTFVEEGQTRGSISGLSAEDVDFIVHDGKTVNTAVVIPLTKDLKGQVHAGFSVAYLPVPQRYEGNGMSVTAPSFNIPPEVTTLKQLKRFIADQYGISPSHVFKLGESYFAHLGLTPHRIHPFAIAAPPALMKDPDTHFIPFYQMMLLQRLISKEPHFMLAIARAYRYFHDELKLEAKMQVKAIIKQRFEGLQPDWSIPLNYETMDMMRQHIEERLQEKHELERQAQHKHEIEEEELKKKRKDAPPQNFIAPPIAAMEVDEQPAQTEVKTVATLNKEELLEEFEHPKESVPEAELSAESGSAATYSAALDETTRKAEAEKKKTQAFKPHPDSRGLVRDFDLEAEIEAFIDEVQPDLGSPRPEKW